MKAYIYAIRSHQTDLIYIGSTIQALSMRMCGHRRDYNNWKNGTYHYVTSFEIIKFEDNYIELLQEVEVESKLELHKIEGENIRNHNCVNRCIAGRTNAEYRGEHKKEKAEYDAKYKAENKETILEKMTEYYQANKEHIAEQKAVFYQTNKEIIISQNIIRYQDNKETILAKMAVPYTCACGSICSTGNKLRHEKSKKHLKAMELKKTTA